MKRIFTILGVFVVVVLIGGLLAVAVMPGEWAVARSVRVEAPASEVFSRVNRLRDWEAWQPWAKRDGALETRYEGPESGVGARRVWQSESSGSGSQEIVRSAEATRIEMALEFGVAGKSASVWEFVERDGVTAVTWSMAGGLEGMEKLFGPAVRSSVGAEFDEALASLKRLVEGGEGRRGSGSAEGGLAEDAAGGGDGDGEPGEGEGVGTDRVVAEPE